MAAAAPPHSRPQPLRLSARGGRPHLLGQDLAAAQHPEGRPGLNQRPELAPPGRTADCAASRLLCSSVAPTGLESPPRLCHRPHDRAGANWARDGWGFYWQVTEGSGALLESDRHLDARRHAPDYPFNDC
ncbi:hypothetical protein NDU88_003184 [Pleurodeles waltl]|uniref:Uncharacterized protein n=1 Tax=Pleurodeles waltl TaxID=8319 RepID=A0AAV7UC21_PLEWA|nr:hypothetical protein NDU88_003184 [Pleurodeles waltl]